MDINEDGQVTLEVSTTSAVFYVYNPGTKRYPIKPIHYVLCKKIKYFNSKEYNNMQGFMSMVGVLAERLMRLRRDEFELKAKYHLVIYYQIISRRVCKWRMF